MPRLPPLVQTLRDATIEVVRPGETGIATPALWRIGRLALAAVIVATNLIGACAVLVIALFVMPEPTVSNAGHVRLLNALLAAGYVAIAVPLGIALGVRGLLALRDWLIQDQPAGRREMTAVLHAPLRLFGLQVFLWMGAAVLFGILNATFSVSLGIRVLIVVALTGLVTASFAYLLTEFLLRPAAARALAHGSPGRLVVPGVATRLLLAWIFGTGVSTFGIVAIGLLALAGDSSLLSDPRSGVQQLGVSMVALGGTGLIVGFLAITLIARTTADPVDAVRRALAEVQRGELDTRVSVYDGTQIGQLQLGFNEMVGGLQERERIREAFGTYVDPDVAERVLSEGTNLSGEQVEVTVMFIDIRNFTGFAESTSADQVVAAINELFAQIVPIIHEEGGRVDKFVGDGLLAVFGAPRRQPDHADRALRAALRIAATVDSSHGLTIGIGLNSGIVVAGNVGGAGRLEFSVIGDPVNVAARVESATRTTGDTILLTERTRELLSDSDRIPLIERHGIALKGKSEPVRLFAPDLASRPQARA